MNNILFAFSLTLFSGLCTGIGSAFAFFAKKTNTKFLSISLGFSAGVMIYVSMIEIFFKAKDALTEQFGIKTGSWLTVVSFFGGMLTIALIDKVIPVGENPHDIYKVEDLNANKVNSNNKLLRTGLFTAIAIAIHNFPEGLATFISGLQSPSIAVPIAVAIAIHNIPEGIAVSVPVYYATGNKKKAFVYSFLSGLSEPLGAIIGYLILMPFISNAVLGIIFGAVAGIMVFISLDELLPSAREYGEHHLSIYGLVGGMILMAVSLLLFL
ncbi:MULTISPECIES: zinc transporter ZupT [Clostridium]|uniref:Zinc transporter ZupT n=1 Tax=Clostridium aquiflavi TaxID=3073603 RepID=A0ABU1EGY7_9CLOT|nr:MULTISPECIES: zinc transporter ZupT [unclassified Clostridium]MDR5587519.1 zinc transporter ZupT [Clostridium sp. 5N-1]NFG62976.1 zinc transporter ZupT [Clostridium botulinum]NFQ09292.1 zinc transporter ZupT [Clostridium botulinum]